MILPSFVIAGAPKSGTSSLHTWLADHPDVVASTKKETYFLSDPGTHMHRPEDHVSNGLAGYARHFPETGHARVIMESTPGYLYSQTALQTLANLPGKPRVLFVLREPGAQILSMFQYFQNNWSWIPPDMTFAAFVSACRAETQDFGGNELAQKCLTNAAYVDHLVPWQKALGPDRMRVTLFDDLKADGAAFTRDLAAWLGIDPAFYDSYTFPHANESYQPRSRLLQSLNIAVRGWLPKGRAYDLARTLYRKTNTRPVDDKGDAETLAAIRKELAPANARLADAFGLDLHRWEDGQ